MVDEDPRDPPVSVELHDLDLEPANAVAEVHGHRVHTGEDVEQLELQARRGRQAFAK